MKFKLLFLLIAFGLTVLTSCEKENVDNLTIEEDEITVEVLTCDSLQIGLEAVIDVVNETVLLSVMLIDGGISPYSYSWSTGEIGNSILVVNTDIYSVTVTDANGCSVSEELDVEVPSFICASLGVMAVENTAGTLTANAIGGTTPYSFDWSTGETTNSIMVTSDGAYSVTVTDANGCIVEDTIIVTVSNPCSSLGFGFLWQPVNGTLSADVMGGVPPYSYVWSTGETTNPISASTGNTYTVSITDASGCQINGSIQL